MYKNLLSLLFVLLVSVTICDAQNDGQIRRVDPKKIPVDAAKLQDFVPAGWMIEKQIKGNINFDSEPDAVLQLVESDDTADEERYRALIILIQIGKGKWRRVGVSDRLLAEFNSGGMKCGTEGDNIKIKLSGKGILSVDQCLGGANLITYTHRFRYEINSKRMRLIGADSENGSPASQLTTTGINYLTGIKISTLFDDRHPKGITKRLKIPTNKILYLEELDNEKFQENGI